MKKLLSSDSVFTIEIPKIIWRTLYFSYFFSKSDIDIQKQQVYLFFFCIEMIEKIDPRIDIYQRVGNRPPHRGTRDFVTFV